MATKAQLQIELAELRQQMASRQKGPDPAVTPDKKSTANIDPRAQFAELLTSHGIDADEIERLWKQFSQELGDLSREKPLLTAAGSFGIGFVLGRMSK